MRSIKDLTYNELAQWLIEKGHKGFRAQQIFQWLYQHQVNTWDEMSNVSKEIRALLAENFYFSQMKRHRQLSSQDGSIKYLFELSDGKRIESVLMPHKDHYTLCVSSQVGCAMGCDFCMTAKMGYDRNLQVFEIIDQILEASKDVPAGEILRNVVFMGMGEPFHNYENLMRSLEILTHDFGLNLSTRRITVSTSGLVPQIIRFGKEKVKANLAISLNGSNDEVRNRLMPVNKAYPLKKLIEACHTYPLESRKRITFEYILIKDVSDSVAHAKQMIKLLHGIKFKLNLIPYNPSPGSIYQRPSWENIELFQRYLLEHGVTATLRISKGQDIQGACGQLITSEKAVAVA